MAVRVITKELGGEEDLLLGEGTTSQTRASNTYDMTRINISKWVADTAAMAGLDTAKFVRASVGDSNIPFRWVEGDTSVPDGDFTVSGAGGNWLKIIEQSALQDYSVKVYDILNTSGVIDIDINNGNVQEVTLSGNASVSFVNPSPEGFSCSLRLIVHQDGYGGASITWPAGVKWAGGLAPSFSATSDIVDLFTTDSGATWYGVLTYASIS